MLEREERQLGPVRAVWDAFWAVDVSHYPRFLSNNDKEEKVEETEIIAKITAELNKLTASETVPSNDNLTRARESLDEVKAFTEYEDQKVTRLLTIVTIFGALAGLVFSRRADMYPVRPIIAQYGLVSCQGILVLATYILFLGFVLLAIF